MRQNKQGVRDLNPAGHNGHQRTQAAKCTHFFGRGLVVIGQRLARADGDLEDHEEPIYGQRCLHCGDTRE